MKTGLKLAFVTTWCVGLASSVFAAREHGDSMQPVYKGVVLPMSCSGMAATCAGSAKAPEPCL